MKKQLLIILILPLFLLLFSQCSKKLGIAGDMMKESWNYIVSNDGSEPEKRHEAGFTMIGDKFYLVGGRGMKPVSEFDTNTGK